MKHIASLFTLMAALGSALRADWKIVTRTGDSSVVEYFKGALMRTDSSPAYTSVLDLDHRRQVSWRSDLRQYVLVESLPEYKSDSSGPVVTIERNTTETGERRQFFGRTARHFVTHITRSDGPDTVTDGWYVDAPRLPSLKRDSGNTVAVLTAGFGGQKPVVPRIEVKQKGPVPVGLPVLVKTTVSMILPGGSHQTNETVSEVTELLEIALPDRLFRPPEGYQRVESFLNNPVRGNNQAPHSFREMLETHWQMIKDWFGGKTDK